MTSDAAFAGVVRAELRFNATRVLPYVIITVFALNALLWWGWGPAGARGVPTNSEGFIAGMLTVFSFMTAPFFTALVMSDPVLRDFEIGIDTLIFSKPIARARYIAAKFLGNYAVLMVCQSAFIAMLITLQSFRKTGMVVGPFMVLPYIRHFIFIVGVSHLAMAAIFFAIATIARSAMASYAAATIGYFVYIAWEMALHGVSPAWRVALDPLLMNSFSQSNPRFLSSSVTYTPLEVGNRLVMLGVAVAALALVQAVFSRRALYGRSVPGPSHGMLELPVAPSRIHVARKMSRPSNTGSSTAVQPSFDMLLELRAVLGAEVRLLGADRVLHFAIPIVLLLSTASVAAFRPAIDASVTGGYAARVISGLAAMLIAVVFFCAGLIAHRDRLLHVDSLVLSTPVRSRSVIAARYLVLVGACITIALATIVAAAALQGLREHGAVDGTPYVASFTLILLPALLFCCALAVLASQLLREKHAYHAVMIALAGAMYFLYMRGHHAWWYNPLHYDTWSYAQLLQPAFRVEVALHGIYWMLLGFICLAAAKRSFSLQRHGVIR